MLVVLSLQVLEKLSKGRKGFASEIDGRSSRRRTGSQVDGPSDDKATEVWSEDVRTEYKFSPQMTDVEEFPLRYSL